MVRKEINFTVCQICTLMDCSTSYISALTPDRHLGTESTYAMKE